MTLPAGTRAPVVTRSYSSGYLSFYRYKTRAWQKAPYNLSLAYGFATGQAQQSQYTGSYYGSSGYNAETTCSAFYDNLLVAQLSNIAYEKLRGKLYDSAALGVDFAEARQSLSMIARTCGTLVKSIREVRKLDFLGAAKTLKLHAVPKGVSVRKSFANNWLEYHFGWSPLISDIFDAAEVMNNPIKTFNKAKSAPKQTDQWTEVINFGYAIRQSLITRTVLVAQGASVRSISNSTYHALDQFGLNNPATILWEIVPFSFVVDWFVNVGDVLRSYSDYSGLTLEQTYTSTMHKVQIAGFCGPNGLKDPATNILYFTSAGVQFSRTPALTAPTLNVKRLKLPSKERALTAVSLVIQQLRGR